MQPLHFPPKFIWGSAAAAPQIEGASSEDGKGPSIWDAFSRVPNAIRRGDTPEVACDHYHRYEEDFELMRKLGIRHYRMSIAWPRILPDGRGAVNRAGIDYYHRVFDSLERHGITPWVTMFHWDLPQALETEGGWRRRGLVDDFAAYADTIVKAFGDRVRHWFTLNEIFCFIELAYGVGQKAPGAREGNPVVNQAYHHALLCHGHGVRAVREHGRRGSQVGLVDNPIVTVPLDLGAENVAAAKRAFAAANIRVLDPIHRGGYAESYLRSAGRSAPKAARGDFGLISLTADFLGLNIYTGHFVRRGARGLPEKVPFPEGFPRADCEWLQLLPQSLYWGPRFACELYRPPAVFITENGAGFEEPASVKGEFPDLHRREYVRDCLRELHGAIREGLPVKGYFLWSILDNFEWEDGYDKRFGIVHVDFKTQKRTPKLSARWYAKVIRRGHLI